MRQCYSCSLKLELALMPIWITVQAAIRLFEFGVLKVVVRNRYQNLNQEASSVLVPLAATSQQNSNPSQKPISSLSPATFEDLKPSALEPSPRCHSALLGAPALHLQGGQTVGSSGNRLHEEIFEAARHCCWNFVPLLETTL